MTDVTMKYECPEILKDKRLLCIDIETTGLDINKNTIIELGVIEVNNGVVVNEYTKLFGGGFSPMYLMRNVHKIQNSERKYKKTFKQCAEKIAEYLSNAIIITHNGDSFDIPMIENKLQEAGYKLENVKKIDTLKIARKLKHESNTLGNLCKLYGINYGGNDGTKSHRGLEDAYATLDLLYYFIQSKKVNISV